MSGPVVEPVQPEPAAPAAVVPTAPATPPASSASAAPEPVTPLHDDPVIAKALEGLTPEQRETLLTQGGRNALAARLQETKDAKAQAAAALAQAETARTEMAQSIGKALGLISNDEPIDPAKLTEELTATKTQARETKLELSIYQAAATVGARADALLDSRSFLKSVAALEPTDSAGIAAAIAAAVEANPVFAIAAPVVDPAAPIGPGVPKPNPAQGTSAGGAPSIDDQIAVATKDGNLKLAMHLQNQKLLSPGR